MAPPLTPHNTPPNTTAATPRAAQRVGARLAQGAQLLLPQSLFARLACLLFVTAVVSHVLAISLMLEWAGPPPPPPAWGPGGGMRPPSPLGLHLGMLMDMGVRLAALMVATWVGARWLTQPMNDLAHAATQWSTRLASPPLPLKGPAELRKATRAFNEMQAEIRQQLSDRDRIVAAVSHDLRTPLTRMRLRVETLHHGQDQDRFRRDIAAMDNLICTTLDHLQGVATAEARTPVDVNALLQATVDDECDAGHTATLTGCAPLVMGQAVALRRCVGNLVGNAIRYGHCAHVSVDVDRHRDAPGQCLRIRVTDTGPGLPEHELEAVKQPFYRMEQSRNPRLGGVGLGLAIANDIAHAHGGSLILSNPAAGGLCATLCLPL